MEALKNPFDVKAPPKKEYNSIIPGSLIRVRGEEWQVIRKRKFIEDDPKSHFEVEAEGLTGIVVGYRSVFLSNIDRIELVSPEDIVLKTDDSTGFKKTKLYLEAMLRNLPIREDDKICVGHKGVFDAKAYQLKPALQALQQVRPRILIGDGVGLGKTIEIGILLSELIKRGKGKRILVVTPKAILTQFQKEIFTRFGIALTRLDSQGVAKLNRMLPSTMNPFMFHDRVIVSMDTLKNDRYLNALERCHWDTVVIDECHNVSIKGGNVKSQRARLARTLCDKAEAVILSSATPHDGTMEGFASLIKLLDPTAIKDETQYNHDDIKHVFIRRTKDTVKDELRNGEERDNKLVKFSLSTQEEAVLHELHNLDLQDDIKTKEKRKRKVKGAGFKELFKTTLIKAFLSSPDALIETVENRMKKTEGEDLKKLDKILTLAKKSQGKSFSKLKKIDELIKEIDKKKKMVFFTERIATLNLLESHLAKYGEVLKMDGGMSDQDLMQVASDFQSAKHKARFLVATNVASEGLNLNHACHHLVHFDLPWSFIVLEQRNGRIDRIGQKHRPHLYYMCAESDDGEIKADLHITEKLAQRIEKAGTSMDDESLRSGFITGSEEEEVQTKEYETGKVEEKKSVFTFMEEDQEENAESAQDFIRNTHKNLESFYETDYDYTKEALELLELRPEVKTDQLIVPMDKFLKFELEEAPSEVTSGDKIKLQFNAKKMNKEIENAITHNEWPDSQWATDYHPLQELIRKKCLDLFTGDETPVVFYNGNSDDHKMGFLIRGILRNKHGQILFEEWAVCTYDTMFKKDAEPYGPYKISEIKQWTGLDKTRVVNPKKELTSRLEKTIMERAKISSDWMVEVMKEKRDERGRVLKPKLIEEQKRIKKWGNERKTALEGHISQLEKSKDVSAIHKKNDVQKELDKLNSISDEYLKLVTDRLSTKANPVIRIMGIFINAGKK